MPGRRSSPREIIASRVVAQTLASLPAEIRREAAQCSIELCDRADCLDESLDEDLLGLFEGHARGDPEPQSPDELPRIRLFLDNLWAFSEANVPLYREEVRTTLLHELAHYLGLDEDAVEAMGLG